MSVPKRQIRAAILKQAFARAQSLNRKFSLRALAQKLELSPGFVSRILAGKSDLPFERVGDFARILKMDKISENRLIKSYSDAKTEQITGLASPNPAHDDIMNRYAEVAESQLHLLSRWYFVAILDLAGCRGFSIDPEWLSKRLGVSAADMKTAVEFLKRDGFLVQDKRGKWTKGTKNIRFPTKTSQRAIRLYHEQLMKKAIALMQKKTGQDDFERRLISGISLAANPENLTKALARLNEVMYEVAHLLAEGECTEVYHLGFQLFPVTNPER